MARAKTASRLAPGLLCKLLSDPASRCRCGGFAVAIDTPFVKAWWAAYLGTKVGRYLGHRILEQRRPSGWHGKPKLSTPQQALQVLAASQLAARGGCQRFACDLCSARDTQEGAPVHVWLVLVICPLPQ